MVLFFSWALVPARVPRIIFVDLCVTSFLVWDIRCWLTPFPLDSLLIHTGFVLKNVIYFLILLLLFKLLIID